MIDTDDLKLKAEIDQIMNSVDNIMKKIEVTFPPKEEEPNPQNE